MNKLSNLKLEIKRFIIVLCNLLIFAAVPGSSLRAFAASLSTVDSTSVTSDITAFLRFERSYYSSESSTGDFDVTVPLYMYYTSDLVANTYLNGYVIFNTIYGVLSFTDSNGDSVSPTYFEFSDLQDVACGSPIQNTSFRLFFNNHLVQNGVPILLGYYHFQEYIEGATTNTIYVTPSSDTALTNTGGRLYNSTSEYGLAQSIVNGINAASDIDEIISILEEISSYPDYTTLLNYVISGLDDNEALLAQIYTYLDASLDDDIDTISWNDASSYVSFNGASSDGSTWSDSISNSNKIYLSFTFNYITNESILLKIYSKLYNSGSQYRNDITLNGVYRSSISNSNILDTFDYYFSNSSFLSNSLLYIDGIRQGTYIFEFSSDHPFSFTSTTLNFYYLSSSDIEYWSILNNIQNNKFYDLLYDYIYGSDSGGAVASSAASDLGSAAANQQAAEESIYALAPGNLSDLDSADAFGVLDNITNSTAFWGDLVIGFSNVSGILWDVFIFSLMVGLIVFILRLR